MRKISNDELNRITVEEFKEIKKTAIILIADNIRSLNNIGSLFRTADAFALEKIMLCGITATPPNREIHKTALGAELTVEWSYHKETVEAIKLVKEQGYTVVAIEQVEDSVMLDMYRVDRDKRYALILGNEVDGVSEEAIELCDEAIEIPQIGTKHSLNVSVAAGVVIWDMFSKLSLLSDK